LPDSATDIYVADTIGELGLLYRVAPIVFVGGSLVPHGGQNPIEPAKLGSAIVHGPYVHNFEEVYDALDQALGSGPVTDGDALAASVGALLADPALIRDQSRRALDAVQSVGGALRRTMAEISPYLLAMHLGH
jgi:3-deoxy-D-manno-octulosonic-acid transferase